MDGKSLDNQGGVDMCGLLTLAMAVLLMPALIVAAIAMLGVLSVLCVPIIFVGWLIGNAVNKNE